ncbi:MAG: Uma2 family endonuclease [Gemmataceae bacterium]
MSPAIEPAKLRLIYEMTEDRYLRSLPLEHFMEATDHATQRKITLESFDLIHAAWPQFQVFNELLVQYPRGDNEFKPGQVVPDNFVVVHPEPIRAVGSFNTPLQPVGPFLVLEYVSKHRKRKDYDDNLHRYQDELKVPYYLVCWSSTRDFALFRHTGERYTAVPPDANGRVAIPELELEAGLLDGWVRYWFRGELLPLPGELLGQLKATQDQLAAETATRQALEAELARLRAELAARDEKRP